jgi:glucose-1-phosphate adenylyltransferase
MLEGRMKRVVAFVLAGGRVKEMGALTYRRAKAALPIAGGYRIIDFAMSNLATSGVDRVGVLTQYRPSSLMDHVGNGEAWGLIGRGRQVVVLTPFQADTAVNWYRGTADAIAHNLRFLQDAEHVLIVAGDHIYHMDYRAVWDAHVSSGAELTMVFKRFPRNDCVRFGNAAVDEDSWVRQYVEKPRDPVGDLASLTVFLFKREALQRYLARAYEKMKDSYQLYDDVIPLMVNEGRVKAVVFDGYWAYARSVDDYYATSMDLLRPGAGFALDAWDVCTNGERSGIADVPPAHVGPQAVVENCRLSPGCRLDGRVTSSIVSPGVVVEEGAVVEECVLMHGVRVARGAHLQRVVVDKHTRIGEGARIGRAGEAVPNEELGDAHRSGVVVVGREAVIGKACVIGANAQVYPRMELPAGTDVADGASCRMEEIS